MHVWSLSTSLHCTVPEDAPTDVIITGISVSSVSITWTPPSIPNGVITHYTIYVDYADGSSIAALYTDNATTIYVLAGLEPYQLVIVYVSASTAIGEGPKSEAAEGRSSEIRKLLLFQLLACHDTCNILTWWNYDTSSSFSSCYSTRGLHHS